MSSLGTIAQYQFDLTFNVCVHVPVIVDLFAIIVELISLEE